MLLCVPTSDHVASIGVEEDLELAVVQAHPGERLQHVLVGHVDAPLAIRMRAVNTVHRVPHAHA